MRFINFKTIHSQSKILLFLIILLSMLLRFPYLDSYPISLYSDETNQGYNAYSILKTGKDEHGSLLPVSFRSFGDWKPPLQTYIMIPIIFVLGLSEMALRLPNAVLGISSIILSYLLIKELFAKYKNRESLALLTAFLLCISPWHLHQSRSAMLIMLALFFFMLGFYFFLVSLRRPKLMIMSVISFVLSIYSYYGMRLIMPLFGLFLIIKYYKQLIKWPKFLFISLGVGIILLLPLFVGMIYEQNVLFGRAKNVSIFFDPGVRLRLSELQTQDGVVDIIPKISQLFHNKPYLYFQEILKRFFVHLEGQFLFLTGDTASPFRIPYMGVLYLIEAIFLPLGLYYIIKNNEKNKDIIIVWLIIAILPAALSFLTPTHNRTFNAVFPLIVLIAYGMVNLTSKISCKMKFSRFLIPLIYCFSIYLYLVNYYKVLPYDFGPDWLYGYKPMVAYLNSQYNNFSKIIFLPKTGMSYTYILFYNQYPPVKFQFDAKHNYKPDSLGFEYVKSFDKYTFYQNDQSWEQILHNLQKGEMYIGREEEIPKEYTKYEIYYPNNQVAFRVSYLEFGIKKR